MNKYITALIIVCINSLGFSQDGHFGPKDKEAAEKIFQLEKIKLIEVLEMDEETAIRFFARRSELKKATDEIQNKIEEIIKNLEAVDKSGKVYTENELITYLNDFNNLHLQMGQMRMEFINSLDDILTYNQIGRLIVFERKFKDELRRALFKERKRFNQEIY
ncbi:MAG TPA: hypothetical protein VI362_05535 [Ignavibacteriaceae bacterium]|nr:hypothetical protein [Ignavibacteriaceae bacterium]